MFTKLGAVGHALSKLAPNVRTIEATRGAVPLELLFDIGGAVAVATASETESSVGHEQSTRPAFETYAYESDKPLSAQTLHSLLRRLPQTVFRTKGLVNLVEKPDHPCVLQSTGRRATLTVGQPWGDRPRMTQIVFIGSVGGVDEHWLKEQLDGMLHKRTAEGQ